MIPSLDEVASEFTVDALRLELEKIRKEQLRSYRKFAIVLAAGFALLISIVFLYDGNILEDDVWLFLLGASIALLFYFSMIKRRLNKGYSKEYKQEMIPLMLDQMMKGAQAAELASKNYKCTYRAEHGVNRSQLSQTKLFEFMKLDILEGEDRISGELSDIQFQYSEIRSEEVYANSEGEKRSAQNFQGFAFLVDFHKDFQGTTIIESRGRSARNYKMKLRKHRGLKTMSTVDVRFNKFYKVRTNDETLTRYLLPVNMLEKLLELGRMFPKKKIAISLNDGLFALVIHRMDLFEIKGFRPVSEQTLRRTYEELKVIMELVFTLGLNRRIWGPVNLNNLHNDK